MTATARIPELSAVTAESVRTWMSTMHKGGLFFHPDDDPSEILCLRTSELLFVPAEVLLLREFVATMFSSLGEQVYEIGCGVLGLIDQGG